MLQVVFISKSENLAFLGCFGTFLLSFWPCKVVQNKAGKGELHMNFEQLMWRHEYELVI